MTRHNQSIFLIEQLQPSWLPTRIWQWLYALVSRLLGGLIIGLAFAVVFVFFGLTIEDIDAINIVWSIGSAFGVLLFGLLGGLNVGFIDVLRFERSRKDLIAKKTPAFWQSAINFLGVWLIVGLLINLLFMLSAGLVAGLSADPQDVIYELVYGLVFGFFYGILTGLAFGLPFGVIFGLRGSWQSLANDIQTVEALGWSWGRALIGGIVGLIGGTVFGLFFGVLYPFIAVQFISGGYALREAMLTGALAYGLLLGELFGMLGAILGGISGKTVETKTAPNQGTWLSLRNAVFAGTLVGPIMGLVMGLSMIVLMLIFQNRESLSAGLGVGLFFAQFLGLLAFLWYGGLDVIQHYILRLILHLNGYLPWSPVRFLDDSVERIFLRRVGGGYIFIHRYLMEYFASLTKQDIERLTQDLSEGRQPV